MKYIYSLLLLFSVLSARGQTPYSGTLPVLFVNTENGDSIKSKEEYIPAKYYIETFGHNGFENIGSREHPLNLLIRGRGNSTWKKFEKKPYKIKFDKKTELLGLKSNKHFALLSHPDDTTGFFRNTVGFELSRMMGMEWTPEQRPVELMLNGEYRGLYFLTETVRPGKNRVNIEEQENFETNPEKVKGGWLVEIDNYEVENQLYLVSGAYGRFLRLTYHSPDSLSDVQSNWLKQEFMTILRLISDNDVQNSQWEEYLDIESLVRFAIITEITADQEAFWGSCFLHKVNPDEKWKFGPVWDFGWAFIDHPNEFTWESNHFGKTLIYAFPKFPSFQNKIKEKWAWFYSNEYPALNKYIDDFASEIATAASFDYERWPNYSGGSNSFELAEKVKSWLNERVTWLNNQWVETTNIGTPAFPENKTSKYLYDMQGRLLKIIPDESILKLKGIPHGVYILLDNSSGSSVSKKVCF